MKIYVKLIEAAVILMIGCGCFLSCGNEDTEDRPTKQEATQEDNENTTDENTDNSDITDDQPIGNIEIKEFVQPADWQWGFIEDNKLNVLRSEQELKELITANSYSSSGVDFEKHTMLLIRVCAANGIHDISSELLKIDANSYSYSVKVELLYTTEIGDKVYAVLAPAISGQESVSLKLRQLTGEDEGIEFIEHERFIQPASWSWKDLTAYELNVVRTEDQLKVLITSESYSASGIDFEKHTLLIVRVSTENGISNILSSLHRKINKDPYYYNLAVVIDDSLCIGDEKYAILVPAELSRDSINFAYSITDAN